MSRDKTRKLSNRNLSNICLFVTAALLSAVILLLSGEHSVYAASTGSGSCGDDVTWTLTSDGTLTISGSGEMTSCPWTIDSSSDYYESIKTVVIEDGVTSIVKGAFYYCTNLTDVSIPDSVTTIGASAFAQCWSLKAVTIPDGVTCINSMTFFNCYDMETVSLSDNITSIGYQAFYECESLTEVSLPESLTYLDGMAFLGCSDLTSVYIPAGIETIMEYAFASALTDVYYGGDEEDWDAVSVDSTNTNLLAAAMHYNCSGLPIDLSGASISLSQSSYTYDGNAKTPSVTVIIMSGDGSETTLTEGTDYTVSYSDNTAPGTASVTITGTGNYTGSASVTFTIVCPHSYDAGTVSKAASCTSAGTMLYTCTICGATKTESISATGHNYSTSKVTTAATCTSAGVRTYYCANDSSHTKTESISATGHTYVNNVCSSCGALKSSSVSSASVTLSKTSYTYSGSPRKPTPTVKVNGTTLTKGTDYTVSYSNNTAIGTATVTITGINDYSGSISKTYTIIPGTVTLSSVKSSAAKTLTVKWSKLSGSVQYQIAYKKSSASSWSYTKVSASTVSLTLEDLTALKKYTVKVRSYKTVDGTTYRGSWSSAKTVTVKKAQSLTVKTKTKTVSYSKVKKAKQTVKAITKVSGAKGDVTYKKSSGKSYFTVNASTGKITVKKGTPKGTYTVKIKVTSSANGNYAKTSKTVSVKIKVK